MGTGLIVGGVIIGIVIIVGGYFGTNYFNKLVEVKQQVAEVQAENTYCENWYNSIEQRSAEIERKIAEYNNAGFWQQLKTDTDYLNSQSAALNAEAQRYNQECYY